MIGCMIIGQLDKYYTGINMCKYCEMAYVLY